MSAPRHSRWGSTCVFSLIFALLRGLHLLVQLNDIDCRGRTCTSTSWFTPPISTRASYHIISAPVKIRFSLGLISKRCQGPPPPASSGGHRPCRTWSRVHPRGRLLGPISWFNFFRRGPTGEIPIAGEAGGALVTSDFPGDIWGGAPVFKPVQRKSRLRALVQPWA